MLLRPLTTNERAESGGFTHVAILTADDLTATVVTTAQTIILCPLKLGDVIRFSKGVPYVPFQQTGVAGNNSTTVSFGDTGSVARHLAATQANLNGTYLNVIGTTPYLVPAATNLTATVTPFATSAPNDINRGEYHIFFTLSRTDDISNAIARARISKT